MSAAEKTIRQLVLNRIGELAMLAEEINADESNPLTARAYINTEAITLELLINGLPVRVALVSRIHNRSPTGMLDALEAQLASARSAIKEHTP